MSHFFLIFGKMAEDSQDIFLKRLRPKGLTCHNNVYLAPNSSYSGICCINLANSNIVIDVIRPLNVNAWEKV